MFPPDEDCSIGVEGGEHVGGPYVVYDPEPGRLIVYVALARAIAAVQYSIYLGEVRWRSASQDLRFGDCPTLQNAGQPPEGPTASCTQTW